MDDEILRLLKAHPFQYLSGEEISRRLKKSRTAIWKRIEHLRSLGYEIEASTRSGYRLVRSPDLLTPAEVLPFLKTRWMGRKIHYFTRLGSTNSTAYELAAQGAEEGEAVVAESQERGKGRLGRIWFSPPFLNLYLSVILRPGWPPHQAPLITLMGAVATAETIERFCGLHPVIKWPNDLLLGGRKVAGLLNEIQSETDRIHFIVLGIGVNLNVDRTTFPEAIQPLATSLREELGRTISRKDFLCLLFERLEEWYTRLKGEGRDPILQAWKEWAQISGQRVRVTSFGEVLSGVAIDIDSEGALLMRTEDGMTRRVVAGDVEYGRSETGA